MITAFFLTLLAACSVSNEIHEVMKYTYSLEALTRD